MTGEPGEEQTARAKALGKENASHVTGIARRPEAGAEGARGHVVGGEGTGVERNQIPQGSGKERSWADLGYIRMGGKRPSTLRAL